MTLVVAGVLGLVLVSSQHMDEPREDVDGKPLANAYDSHGEMRGSGASMHMKAIARDAYKLITLVALNTPQGVLTTTTANTRRRAMANVENGPVVAHAQAFADDAAAKFGTVFKTYNGHSPTRDRALDCWDTPPDLDALSDWVRANYRKYAVDYQIWRQRIWNPEIKDAWRHMAWRNGNNDPNHMKHLHVSFEATGTVAPKPSAPLPPAAFSRPMLAMGDKGDSVMFLQGRLVAHGHNVKVDGDFGPHTRARVQIHQAAWKLVPDGIVGPATWPSLLITP